MTPDPNEVLTVALTAEQAEHVRWQVLADFCEVLGDTLDAGGDRARGMAAGASPRKSLADTTMAKIEPLCAASPTYVDRRCELVQLADGLLEAGAALALTGTDLERIREHDGDEAAVRERVLQLAPAFTARAILDQIPGRGDR